MTSDSGGNNSTLRNRKSAPQREGLITWKALKEHRQKDDCWIAFEGKAYDVTEWCKSHPGGAHAILNVGGRDATDLIKQFHVKASYAGRITKFEVGEMEEKVIGPNGKPEFAEEFRVLRTRFENEGWYDSDKTWYIWKSLHVIAIFVAAWLCVKIGAAIENVYLQYFGAFCIGMFWQQGNFLGHDAGHGSVVKSKFWNDIYGLFVGNMSTGLSIAWWKHSHYTHHVVTNVIPHDPDIQHLPVLAISTAFFKGFHSAYWGADIKFDEISRFLISYQNYLFYPIMSVSRILLNVQAVFHVLFHVNCPNRLTEWCALCVFWAWWPYMLSHLPDYSSMLMFWYISHATVAIIHVQICLSHFIMETFDDVPYECEDESFFEFQLRTTLDIECPPYMDWFHGGLQYQVIHHLYPRLPRHHLREVSHMVQEICDRHGVTYHHYDFFTANVKTVEHLRIVADAAKSGKFIKFEDTLLFHAMTMEG